MASTLDDIDRRILAELGRDGRMPIRKLAETLHISRANAYARVQRLRETNVIKGFRADVDHVSAGMGTSAYVTVNLRQADWRPVRERLRALPGVVHIALVGGEFDVILLVRARDNADLRRLVLDEIQGMPGVVNTRTLLVFEEFESPAPASAGEPAPPRLDA
ncbi:AsnC family transcriptional regulator [Actinoplanes teichomyceticus]|uniref:AsnC family transcriptional regulator n=1 Tax=Actinoplanes teichomyceticus TaxID=1867 RepID=A0A561WK50_ACTTI|nr:Lrp/AsnC family transcriptional regulator [Actinoplanes teichomyceticus]TWG24242.1 AsnC family transcriptional regulator [Actinoplanes teichomyceticus]GIF12912.1 transcriptional regulator [Actinoplanes teichomyceticus]